MGSLVGETYLKRLVVFYIPLFMFVFAMLFPFFWMLITSLKPDPELYNPRLSPFLVRDLMIFDRVLTDSEINQLGWLP